VCKPLWFGKTYGGLALWIWIINAASVVLVAVTVEKEESSPGDEMLNPDFNFE
jgi:hypothetical protein